MSEDRSHYGRRHNNRGARPRHQEFVEEFPEELEPEPEPERFSKNGIKPRKELQPPSEIEQLEEELRAIAKRYGWDRVDRHWVTVRRQIEQGD